MTAEPGGPALAIRSELGLPVVGDGVTLRTDVHRPQGDGAWPVVLMRTPYGSGATVMLRFGRLLARQGFAVVIQNVRGRHGSSGTFEPFRHEQADGAATLVWLAHQPWCDGRLIPLGISYSSHTACALCALPPPTGLRLVGMISLVAMARPYTHFFRGGAFVLHWALPWSALIAPAREHALDLAQMKKHLLAPLGELPARLGLPAHPWLDWLEPNPASAYWRSVDALPGLRECSLPGLHLGGWYDFSLESTLELYHAMARPDAPPQRLILGPWEHNEVFAALLGALARRSAVSQEAAGSARPEALPDERHPTWLGDELLGCMEAWCKRAEPRDRIDGASVRLWCGEAGTKGGWVDVPRWPPRSAELRFYLQPLEGHDGRLTLEPPVVSQPATRWRHDPANPVPTQGGRCWAAPGWMQAGPCAQEAAVQRDDVVRYTSEPLAEDLTVAGEPQLHLTLGADGEDAPIDVCGKLIDLPPGSAALWVADGIVRRRASASSDPAAPRWITLSLGGIGYRFRRGHRIRVEIAASSFPQFDRTLGAGERYLEHPADTPPSLALPLLREPAQHRP